METNDDLFVVVSMQYAILCHLLLLYTCCKYYSFGQISANYFHA